MSHRSVDVERISEAMEEIHEFLASFVRSLVILLHLPLDYTIYLLIIVAIVDLDPNSSSSPLLPSQLGCLRAPQRHSHPPWRDSADRDACGKVAESVVGRY